MNCFIHGVVLIAKGISLTKLFAMFAVTDTSQRMISWSTCKVSILNIIISPLFLTSLARLILFGFDNELFYSWCSVNNEGHKPDQIICDVCGHRYISENDLNVHMQSLHSGYNNFSSITSSSCKINPESANKNVDSLEDNCDLIVLTEPSHAGIPGVSKA